MKIADIRLKNLNSLQGEWRIDFSCGSYASDGIFAITGPTGAGKTTIFDAICLALYAQTPRLGKISGQNNEIMSKHTNECYAQVIFEVDSKKYICLWSQHRAGKKDKLQTAKHILSECNGKILAEKTSETIKLIETLTGLDFKRFTQAVMLEQGGFDAFLKANAGDRSQILELLTGTEIYGLISTRIYERADSERQKLEEIRIQIDTLKPRDNYGTEDEIRQALEKVRAEYTELEAQHNGMKAAIDWQRNIATILCELDGHNERLEHLRKQEEQFTQDGRRLDAALRARELMAAYARLTGLRGQFRTIRARAERYGKEIARSERELADIETVQLPEVKFEYERRVRNIPEGETPESICARARELVKVYRDNAKKKPTLEAGKLQAETILRKTQEEVTHAEEEYAAVQKRHEELFVHRLQRDLKPGEPCPVCGSLEHPVSGNASGEEEVSENIPDFGAVSRRLREAVSCEGAARDALNQRMKELNDNTEAIIEARGAVLGTVEVLGIYGAKNVQEMNDALTNWLSEVGKLDMKIKLFTNQTEKLRAEIEVEKKTLQYDSNTINVMTGELETAESDFAAMLREKGFDSEEQFVASCLRDNVVEELKRKKTYLDDGKKQLQALIADRTEKLNAERAKAITTQLLEELLPVYQEHEDRMNALRREIYSLEGALLTRKELQRELGEKETERLKQERVYSEWSALSALIGQKDGGKFRKFAQSMTLRMMIGLANDQLKNLNGRYSLTAAPDDGELKLCVIDHEQAGEVRPTENLSGGERFVVSLALALGLSQISGSRARVDSLFLDEGFGSLDDEALNTALEALGELRQREGRMIGIISHVQALKDRIPAQINVVPKREGVSVLEGVGCSRK